MANSIPTKRIGLDWIGLDWTRPRCRTSCESRGGHPDARKRYEYDSDVSSRFLTYEDILAPYFVQHVSFVNS
jgi:hypothetical protein